MYSSAVISESITVNLADSLEVITSGFLKSSVHRVVARPPDQSRIDGPGLLYFVRPEDEMKLKPVQSALLGKLGLAATAGAASEFTAGEWVKAMVKGGVSGGKSEKRGERGGSPSRCQDKLLRLRQIETGVIGSAPLPPVVRLLSSEKQNLRHCRPNLKLDSSFYATGSQTKSFFPVRSSTVSSSTDITFR